MKSVFTLLGVTLLNLTMWLCLVGGLFAAMLQATAPIYN